LVIFQGHPGLQPKRNTRKIAISAGFFHRKKRERGIFGIIRRARGGIGAPGSKGLKIRTNANFALDFSAAGLYIGYVVRELGVAVPLWKLGFLFDSLFAIS
jgi:hypothetical protein